MTPSSVLHASLALLWCATILVSLAGWGFLIAGWLRLRHPGIGLAASLGIAFTCGLGSLMNVLHLVSSPVLLAFTIAGVALFAWARIVRRDRTEASLLATPAAKLLLVVAIALIVLHLFSFVRMARYNSCEAARVAVCPRLDCQAGNCNLTAFTAQADDLEAYMFMPAKMLELHFLAPDPYSMRRIEGSLGYNYFLQDIFLAAGDMRNVSIVDGGLGVLLLALLAIGLARALGLTSAQTLVFFLLAAYTKQIYWNLSFVWLPCALFLAMALLAYREDLLRRPGLQALLLGAVGGAAVAMKGNYLVYIGFFILIFYCLLAFLPRIADLTPSPGSLSAAARAIGLGMVGALAVIGLWMFDLHRTSGTWFFPILGHGFEYTTYGLLPTRGITNPNLLVKCFAFAIPSFLAAAAVALWARRSVIKLVVLSAALASALSTIVVGFATGADMLRRYCYPQIMIALLLLFPLLCFDLNARRVSQAKPLRFGGVLQLAVCALVLFAYVTDVWNSTTGFDKPAEALRTHLEDFLAGFRDAPLNSPQVIAEYRAVQASLPPHSVALETVTYPYLFDNTRNTIFESSFPAMASPPPAPGWPIHSDGETLGAWLLSHNIHYLIYSYVDQALNSAAMLDEIADMKKTAVVRAISICLYKSHIQYAELAKTRRHIFDDGSIFVLDLDQRQ